MRYTNKHFILLVLITFITSCDQFPDINKNKNNPTTDNVTVDVLLTDALNDHLDIYGGYGTGRSSVFTQQFAGNHATGVEYDQYRLLHGYENGTMPGLFRGAFMNYRVIIEKGETGEQKNRHYAGVSKIMLAFGLGFLTDWYGDIPYSKAFDPNITSVPYDNQEEIYNTIFELLSTARVDLETPAYVSEENTIDLKNGDFIYDGDPQKWIALSWMLEARYSNHVVRKGVRTNADVLTAVTNARNAGFTDFVMPYEGTSNHQSAWGEHRQSGGVIASEVFMKDLYESPVLANAGAADIRDPRLEAYFDNIRASAGTESDTLSIPGTYLEDGVTIDTYVGYIGINPVAGTRLFGKFDGYTGKPNGFGTSSYSYSPLGPYGIYGDFDSSQPLATVAELYFIEAEAALDSDPARALAAFKAGAKHSVNSIAPFSYDTFDAGFEAGDPDLALHKNALTQRITDYNNAIDAIATITIEDVMTEKYRAMFGLETEIWVDLRRHNYAYPSYISIPVDGATGQPVSTEFIQRFLYPQEELDQNGKNVPSGLDQFTKLWWAQ